jgi:Thiamine pyrophosphate enzyme, N-terminal TPP binding domain
MSTGPSRWMTIGDFLLRRLEEAGVGHLFGVPGDFNLELLQQLEDTGTVKWVGNCSELNAAEVSGVKVGRLRPSPWRRDRRERP